MPAKAKANRGCQRKRQMPSAKSKKQKPKSKKTSILRVHHTIRHPNLLPLSRLLNEAIVRQRIIRNPRLRQPHLIPAIRLSDSNPGQPGIRPTPAKQRREPQTEQQIPLDIPRLRKLAELTGVPHDERRKPRLIGARKTRHIRIARDISRMLVIRTVRNRQPDLMQRSRPPKEHAVLFTHLGIRLFELIIEAHRE